MAYFPAYTLSPIYRDPDQYNYTITKDPRNNHNKNSGSQEKFFFVF